MRAKLTLAIVLIATVLVAMTWPIDTAECGGVVEDELISYWSFDDIEGDTVNDAWGKNHGTFVGDPEIVAKGKTGNALDAATGYVEFDDANMPAGNDPRTICAWVKLAEKVFLNDDNAVISWGAAGDAELSGMLVREGGTAYFVGAMADMESNGTMKVGVWNHITITYDGKLLRIYINSKLDKEDPPGLQWDPKKARKLNTVLNTGTIGILSVGGEAPFDVGHHR